jgi:hypothetical protein
VRRAPRSRARTHAHARSSAHHAMRWASPLAARSRRSGICST